MKKLVGLLPILAVVFLYSTLSLTAKTLPVAPISPSSNIKTPVRNLELVGRIGGQTRAVAVQGLYAYIGEGPDFVVLSVTDPATPTEVGRISLSHNAQDVAISGNYAYVAEGGNGLEVVYISNAAHPLIISSYTSPSSVDRIAISGHYAYIAAGSNGLRIVDISNPFNLHEVGAYTNGGAVALRVVTQGHYAYVIDGNLLRIIDISNPSAPFQVSTYQPSWYTSDLAVAGTYVYVGWYGCMPFGDCNFGGMDIVNIVNPAAPTLSSGYTAKGATAEIAVSGTHAYLGISQIGSWVLEVVNISSKSYPVQSSTHPVSGTLNDLAVGGTRLYADAKGLQVMDVSNSANPINLGVYAGDLDLSSIDDVVISDHMLYATGAGDSILTEGTQLIDVSTPVSPTVVNRFFKFNDTNIIASQSVAVSGNSVYLGWSWAHRFVPFYGQGLDILDATNPIALTTSSSMNLAQVEFGCCRLTVSGHYVYVASPNSLWAIDVSVPTSPTLFSSLHSGEGYIGDIAVSGKYSYVARGGAGVRIIDVSIPITSVEVSHYLPPGSANDVVVSGFYAYIAAGEGGLRVVDIISPTDPAEVGSFISGAVANQLVIDGRYVYIAEDDGVRVVDISNPAVPAEAGFFAIPDGVSDIAVDGNYIFAATGSNGITILHLFGHLAGRVTDVHGTPIAGVTISVSSGFSATTDVSGLYNAGTIDPGVYTLTPTTVSNAFFWPTQRTISIPSYSDSSQNFIMLPRPVSVTLTPGITAMLIYTDLQGLTTDITFPADAVTQTITLWLTPTIETAPAGLAFAGHAFDLTAVQNDVPLSSFDTNVPVTVTIRYSDLDIRIVADESELALRWWDGVTWEDAATTCTPLSAYTRDTLNNVIGVPICHFGIYALFGPTHQILLPIVWR